MFVAMGLSAVVPVFHGIRVFGVDQLNQQMGLSWLVTQGFLYILGAGIYAVSELIHTRCSRATISATESGTEDSSRSGGWTRLTTDLTDTFVTTGSSPGTMVPRLFRHLGQLASNLPRVGCLGGWCAFGRLVEGF